MDGDSHEEKFPRSLVPMNLRDTANHTLIITGHNNNNVRILIVKSM